MGPNKPCLPAKFLFVSVSRATFGVVIKVWPFFVPQINLWLEFRLSRNYFKNDIKKLNEKNLITLILITFFN